MPAQTARKPTLIDAMILVAAAAVGFAGIRAEQTRHLHESTRYGVRPLDPPRVTSFNGGAPALLGGPYVDVSIAGPVAGPVVRPAWFLSALRWAESARLAAPCLASLSLAMLLIRSLSPRPSWNRLIRQTGSVAILGATLAMGIRLAHALSQLLLESIEPTMTITIWATSPLPSRFSWIACQATQPHSIGVVVLSAWLALAAGGRRREHSWIESTGIAVGVGWVALFLIDLLPDWPA